MLKTVPSTLSGDGVLHLTCPRSWKEMSQEQLRYALHVIGCGLYSSVEGRTLMLLQFTGIEVNGRTPQGWACTVDVTTVNGKQQKHRFLLQSWQVQDMIKQLEYVDSYETFDVRLESIGGFKAVDALLHRVMFQDYLNMEKYYQGYLATKEARYALGLARLLYPTGSVGKTDGRSAGRSAGKTDGRSAGSWDWGRYAASPGIASLDDGELMNCVMWFSYVKMQFSRFFHHFFKPAPGGGKTVDWMEQMNAQIRALTDGDITKESAVLEKDCWRALTELDAKAREAEEFRKRYPKA